MNEQDLLAAYVTNQDDQVFGIHGLDGIVGAVMARYSRAETGFRETLLREFIKEDKLKLNRARKLIERVLIAYGDDSVGELEGAHLSFEDISLLATKVIEHRRIGGSPIEQSTRYVRYDFKKDDGFHYHLPANLQESAQTVYRVGMDRIFEQYSAMWQILVPYLEQRKPLAEAVYDLGEMGSCWSEMKSEKHQNAFMRTYRADIKTKACDILRAFLPLATKANVGLFGNGRFFQHLISKLMSDELEEAQMLGGKAFHELSKIIPHYVKRAKRSEYLAATRRSMVAIAERFFGDLTARDSGIQLVEPDHDYMATCLANGSIDGDAIKQATRAETRLNYLASLVFPFVRAEFSVVRDRIKALSPENRQIILDTYYGDRQQRRDRPERGIEYGYPYLFDMVTEWAVYKDLMRHRIATIQVQPLVPDLGFEMPEELADAGLASMAQETVAIAEQLFQTLNKEAPGSQAYAVLQGHKVRWQIGINDRALMHMLELRTAPQGHLNYRRACQQMCRLAEARYPERIEKLTYVNHDAIFWSRGDSEARQRQKEAHLEDQHSEEA